MKRITVNREVLLVEIVRYCMFPDCNQKTAIALTKAEALSYHGFECSHCKQWNEDTLSRQDIPDWWHEIDFSR